GDCSLIGIDILATHEAFDLMTQFVCPGVEVGEAAAQLLERRIERVAGQIEGIRVPPVLRERSSVAGPKG
ncbi:MAG: hypothetical protein GX616_14215, partial [Planctomycetes bacterium]|nr:hypothetical protein [Planctomycetota bacterium]